MNTGDGSDKAFLLARAGGGDMQAWGALLALHQERLQSVISFRLDPRLRRRVDVADVMQEAFIAATARRSEFFAQSTQPLFLWLRWMIGNTLLELHRHHLGAQMRDPKREVFEGGGGRGDRGSDGDGRTDVTRAALVAELTAGATGPATAAGRADISARLYEALDKMDPTDREVLAMRHFEQLSSAETAQVLGINERAAAKRYTRALERLREILAEMSGGLTELRP